MKQISTVKNQTIFDLAVQAYGNIEAAFQILADNPHLAGLNDNPAGYVYLAGTDFEVANSILEGVTIHLQDALDIENTNVVKQLETVIS